MYKRRIRGEGEIHANSANWLLLFFQMPLSPLQFSFVGSSHCCFKEQLCMNLRSVSHYMQKQHVNDAVAQLQKQACMILSQECFHCITELWNHIENKVILSCRIYFFFISKLLNDYQELAFKKLQTWLLWKWICIQMVI